MQRISQAPRTITSFAMEYACLNNTVTRMLSAAFAGRGRLAVLPQHGAAINKATATARTAASSRRYWQPSLAASSIKSRPQAFCQLAQVRAYATHKDTPNKPSAHRRQITLTQDDGRVRWAELSPREKFTRGTQQSLNFSMVVVGAILTVSHACRCLSVAIAFGFGRTNTKL